jgi:hypothetical protein
VPETSNPSRRLLERFALIAFGLYHIPLFLNNYPSLGGGGFSEDGLAVKWGHLFTPAGMWVARSLFHMSGPMPAAVVGDNGDTGEEFGRLLLAVVIGVVGAAAWTLADRKKPRGEWVEGTLRVLLRYSIALGLASYAVAKLLPTQFPPLTPSSLENRIGDLAPMRLLWNFMQYSRPYAFFGGLMEMTVVVLLCFRRTATLGALICIAVMSNVALLNLAYGVPVKLYSMMIVVSAAVLVLYDVPRLFALLVRNQPLAPAPDAPVLTDRLPAPLRWTIKIVLIGSVILSSYVAVEPSYAAQRVAPAPADGAWVITSFALNGKSLDSTGNPARWRRLIVETNGVTIRMETDSLMRCRRTAPAEAGSLKFTCSKGRQGDLRWTRTGDVLHLDGVFDSTQVSASGLRTEYPLMRSKFRWIFDR